MRLSAQTSNSNVENISLVQVEVSHNREQLFLSARPVRGDASGLMNSMELKPTLGPIPWRARIYSQMKRLSYKSL